MSKSKFAITYTVKNESRLLPSAIEYHLALGCSQIYVFFDGTTDNTAELIQNIDNVKVFDTIKPGVGDDLPTWMAELMPEWDVNMDTRKRINTYYASIMAFNEGIEWITCIDPDELLLTQVDGSINSKMVPNFLSDVPKKIDQIFMRNLEVVPTNAESDNPFLDCTIFLNRFPMTEFIRRYLCAGVRRIVNPERLAWFDYWFYKIRFFNAIPRLMINPLSGKRIPASYFLGYSNHKSFIRTSRCGEFNFVIHKWVKYKRRPKSIYRGYVLHYDIFDYKYMALKFKQRLKAPHLPKPFYVRDTLETIASEASDDSLRIFFENYIAILDHNKINDLVSKKIAIRINSVSHFFNNTVGLNK